MAAAAQQEIAAGRKRRVQVEAFRRAAAAAAFAVFGGNDDDRAAETVHQAAGHNADDAGVPAFARHDQHAVVQAGRVGLQGGQRGRSDLLLGLLAQGVDLVKARGDTGGLVLVFTQKQLEGHGGVVHAARRVEARGEAEADRFGRDGAVRVPGGFQQRLQAGAHRILQNGKALLHDGAVFTLQRHHVGNGAERGQLAEHLEQVARGAVLERGAELERHARAAQALAGAFVVGAVGVDDGGGPGQRFAGQVVVGDDQVETEFGGAIGFGHGGDAVVHRDDELIALGGQAAHGLRVEAVTAAVPAGQLAAHMRALVGKAFVQDGGGGNAVDIIIAKNDDGFLVFDGLADAFDRFVHILEPVRVGQFRLFGQQAVGLLRRFDAARRQHPAEQRPVPGRLQRGLRGGVGRRSLPDPVVHRCSPLLFAFTFSRLFCVLPVDRRRGAAKAVTAVSAQGRNPG